MNYNDSQLKAINHNLGPALVLAGPGSGKTAVITRRIMTLIDTYHVNPSNILVITFTKAAAMEMKERFLKLMDNRNMPVQFGTFHAVFFTILKHGLNYSSDNIIVDEEKYNIIKNIIGNISVEYDNEASFIKDILEEISKVKAEMLDVGAYYPVNCSKDVFEKIYTAYNSYLTKYKKLDFDDILNKCHELLSTRGDLLRAWQDKYKYILIDEFQDINIVQYKVIQLLSAPQNNIFVVGDDDQSIYGFRGARPEIMKSFEKDYAPVQTITLNINYRCEATIVGAAMRLINNNNNRYYKDIIANKEGKHKVRVRRFEDIFYEADYVIDSIRKCYEKGLEYRDIAIITRTNDGARHITEKLIEYNIPFVSREKMSSLYSHWIAQNIMAYINMALGNRERSTFLGIMNRPQRYISRDMLTTSSIDFEELKKAYSQNMDWMVERIDKLEFDLKMISDMNPFAAINYIRRAIGYDKFIDEYAQNKKIDSEELYEILTELSESAREFDNYEQWFRHIDEYEKMLREKEKQNKQNTNGVNILTMHGAKGLEYKNVFILDANEGVIPYKKAVLDNDIEEERRLMYVAMTRAKNYLNILYVDKRYNKEAQISRFVEEICGTAK